MLVIMEHRDIQALLELCLDLEAAGRCDILQIDAAEAQTDVRNGVDDLISVLGIDAQRECIHVCKFLEQCALALHNGHCSQRSDVTQSEDCSAVRDNCHQIVAACQLIGE